MNSGLSSLNLFAGDAHRPFHWQGGKPAALLIHGFLGTPAEMRPLAKSLNQAGWTVEGLLLPGFGEQIDTLFERRDQDWHTAARSALEGLATEHRPLLVVGYSMGAAVALNVSADYPPDALVLLAPFWRIGRPIHRLLWAVFKRLIPRPQPFKRADFADPRIGALLGGLSPDIQLSDPQVQDTLRSLRIPTKFMDELLGLGRAAKRASSSVHVPTLIIQGTEDEAVRVEATRKLLQDFPGPVTYKELAADHELLAPQQPTYSQLVDNLLSFAQVIQKDNSSRLSQAPLMNQSNHSP